MLLNDDYLFEFMDSQRRGVGSRTTSDRSYGNVQHIILDFGDGTGYMISNNGLQIRAITHENNGEYELVEGRRGSLYPIGTKSPTEIRWSEVSNLS